jgi:YbgC/YbaW family acyl-CoA thioester hydrolase
MTDPTSHQFRSEQLVHYDMTDLTGVLHNTAYLLLFERARTHFWRSHGLSPGMSGSDWPFVVARNEIDYHLPIDGNATVVVACEIERLTASSVTFAHTIALADGRLAASGKTVLVRIDAGTRRSVPWSDTMRQLFISIMPRRWSSRDPEASTACWERP